MCSFQDGKNAKKKVTTTTKTHRAKSIDWLQQVIYVFKSMLLFFCLFHSFSLFSINFIWVFHCLFSIVYKWFWFWLCAAKLNRRSNERRKTHTNEPNRTAPNETKWNEIGAKYKATSCYVVADLGQVSLHWRTASDQQRVWLSYFVLPCCLHLLRS